ncbi:M20/M25/M40 family metallo-hydrolase [Alteromonas mediterranea]|uniref:M20/M25/M40 family metallo-hydrolase n=1 Tax=Alteromonas mediterranea TaxID=314275 RepID=UPI0011302A39|nr:M20/M25/M40 family metallo-hydrolase [Alteromonas mediterranea]QDG35898.1 M20/M25/M40 family metallo-hydrolase [Alteromonas mediterranea]
MAWRKTHLSSLLILPLLCCLPVYGSDSPTDSAAKRVFEDYLEYITLPNVATQSASDIEKVAKWTADKYSEYGFKTQLLENNGLPMLYADYMQAGEHAPTVLFYAHMDGQPVNAEMWDQESPWQPTLKVKENGQWTAKPLSLLEKEYHPNWRIFARSASDDKAPIMMLLAAVHALASNQIAPSVNIKVLLDSNEEGGSPTLARVIENNKAQLSSDAIVMLDGPMHPSNTPTLVFGHRGATLVKLTVFGPVSDSHSGHFGNYIQNPAFMLSSLLAGMKNDKGQVTIEHYYGDAPLAENTKQVLQDIPIDETALLDRLGVAKPESVGSNYYESISLPSLNINGLSAASTTAVRTIIPAEASATIDIRTTKEAHSLRQLNLLKNYIKAKGYHIIDEAPTKQLRAAHEKLLRFETTQGTAALQTPLDAPVGLWAKKALESNYDGKVILIPMMGGTVPTAPLVDSFNKPVILVPLVNADNNQHAPNENFRIGNFFSGSEVLYQLLTTPFAE